MQTLYFAKQLKNGLWRLYKSVPQAIIAWRGTNDKISVIRDIGGEIINFRSFESAAEYCREEFKSRCLTEDDVRN